MEVRKRFTFSFVFSDKTLGVIQSITQCGNVVTWSRNESLHRDMAFSIHMADRLRLSPFVKIQPGTGACAQVPATSDQHHLASKNRSLAKARQHMNVAVRNLYKYN